MQPREMDTGQRQALMTLRIIWAAMVFGQVVIAAVLMVLMLGMDQPLMASPHWLFVAIPAGMLAVAAPAGYFIRGQVYKANWQGQVVTPSGYSTGNIVLLAILESVAIIALVLMFVGGWPPWPGVIALLALVIQAVNFPTGAPMRPHPPGFGVGLGRV